jgi:hypothetical protein
MTNPTMDYEHRNAIKQGERNGAAEAYFKARHDSVDTIHNRRIFEAGFDRGYDVAPTQSTQQPDAGEPVAWIEYEICQDDMVVATTNDPKEASHYAAVHSKDGPVSLVKLIRTPVDIDAALAAKDRL